VSFQGECTLALRTDVKGRNIPPVRSSAEWLFVEAIGINTFARCWDIPDFEGLLRQMRASTRAGLPHDLSA
jgi:hypothetical protein